MSKEHAVEVVRLGAVEPHPDTETTLDLTLVHGGYPCIIRRGTFAAGDLAVYLPIDTLVPVAHEHFAFLKDRANSAGLARIKAIRLRGVFSMGLLIPAPEGSAEGDDVAAALGTDVWEAGSPNREKGPDPDAFPDHSGLPTYTDIEGLRRYSALFDPGEIVVATEKIHGENARFCHLSEGGFWIGSRTRAKDPAGETRWAQVARAIDLPAKLALIPDVMISGECYGYTGGFPYDGGGKPRFRAFDALDKKTRRYLDFSAFESLMTHLGIEMAPVLYRGPFSGIPADLAEGPTTLGGGHTREGYVVRPLFERVEARHGRVILKMVGQGFLLKAAKGQ